MSIKGYVSIMLTATLMSWIAWGLVVFSVSPQEAGGFGMLLFYLSLFLALLGSLALIGLLIRHLHAKKKFIVEKVLVSFRQGFWFALVVVMALLLQSQNFLSWWNILLLVLIATILEFFFMSAHTNREHRRYI